MDYFADAKLMIILSILETGKEVGDLEKRITYYENYTKKYRVSLFHQKFDGFLIAYQREGFNRSLQKTKDLFKRYQDLLSSSMETFNPFHHLFLWWLKSKVK